MSTGEHRWRSPVGSGKVYAYDKASGRLLAEIPLPANAGGAPMTYMAGGKQYVAFSIGGSAIPEELIAFTLP